MRNDFTMTSIEKLSSVSQFNSRRGQETLHPLVTVIDQAKSNKIKGTRYLSEIYIVFLKDVRCEDFQYGRTKYDYQEETLLFISPDQVFGLEKTKEELIQPKGWALAFHPDFIKGTPLSRKVKEYGFFSYHVTEALHMSERERQIVLECFKKIQEELQRGTDKHSTALILSNIELFFHYCSRFYDRQFITRDTLHKGVIKNLDQVLTEYFHSEKPLVMGFPSVSFCAGELKLSPNYFGDLVKKNTGKTALEYIQLKLIEEAKERIFQPDKTISEVAVELGFRYPQHFTRLFKQKTGMSPNEYRNMN